MSKCGTVTFFILWLFLFIVGAILLFANVRWHELDSTGDITGAVVILIILSFLHTGVMESLTISLITIVLGGKPAKDEKADCSNLTLILNYNVLALAAAEVDEAMGRMYDAFMGNITDNVSAVYVSATKDPFLVKYETLVTEKYRGYIFNILQSEGEAYVAKRYDEISYFRHMNLWRKLEERHGIDHIMVYLDTICEAYSKEFMCIHRVSKVLKKCGQYQDLMLLSDGYYMAYTYTDKNLYGPYARPFGELMFYDSDDVRNIHGKDFDYTFVLDGDCNLHVGVAHDLLAVAASKPEKGILQPAVKYEADIWETIYMNLEELRQKLGLPVTNALGRLFGQCGFFGKALIKNRTYIDEIIGSPDLLLEKVPIDVISHDTYEAAILKPYYVGSIAIIEKPTYNYLAWNNRQRRWNVGDMINGMYFHPVILGAPIQALQKCVQGKRYFRPCVRTVVPLNFLTSYIADASLRGMLTKPLWLLLVLIHGFLPVPTYYPLLPMIVVLVIEIVVSKIPLFLQCHKAILCIIPELISSVFQFTPEIITGFIRIIRVLYMLICGKFTWIPQRHVEDAFNTVNPFKIFIYSIWHLFGYALFVAILIFIFLLLDYVFSIFSMSLTVPMIMIYFDLACIFLLPMYCFITSLRICRCYRRQRNKSVVSHIDSLSTCSSHFSDHTTGDVDNGKEAVVFFTKIQPKQEQHEIIAQNGVETEYIPSYMSQDHQRTDTTLQTVPKVSIGSGHDTARKCVVRSNENDVSDIGVGTNHVNTNTNSNAEFHRNDTDVYDDMDASYILRKYIVNSKGGRDIYETHYIDNTKRDIPEHHILISSSMESVYPPEEPGRERNELSMYIEPQSQSSTASTNFNVYRNTQMQGISGKESRYEHDPLKEFPDNGHVYSMQEMENNARTINSNWQFARQNTYVSDDEEMLNRGTRTSKTLRTIIRNKGYIRGQHRDMPQVPSYSAVVGNTAHYMTNLNVSETATQEQGYGNYNENIWMNGLQRNVSQDNDGSMQVGMKSDPGDELYKIFYDIAEDEENKLFTTNMTIVPKNQMTTSLEQLHTLRSDQYPGITRNREIKSDRDFLQVQMSFRTLMDINACNTPQDDHITKSLQRRSNGKHSKVVKTKQRKGKAKKLENIEMKKLKNSGMVVDKTIYSETLADLIENKPDSWGSSGLQGTFVYYRPRGTEGLSRGHRFFKSEKLIQVGVDSTLDKLYSFTFNPARHGMASTRATHKTGRSMLNVLNTDEIAASSLGIVDRDTPTAIVSGVEINRMMHLDISPPKTLQRRIVHRKPVTKMQHTRNTVEHYGITQRERQQEAMERATISLGSRNLLYPGKLDPEVLGQRYRYLGHQYKMPSPISDHSYRTAEPDTMASLTLGQNSRRVGFENMSENMPLSRYDHSSRTVEPDNIASLTLCQDSRMGRLENMSENMPSSRYDHSSRILGLEPNTSSTYDHYSRPLDSGSGFQNNMT